MSNLAGAYQAAGKLDLALPLCEETLKLKKAKLGAEHPLTLFTMNNLAMLYGRQQRLDLSIPLLEETLRLREKKLGRQHPDTLFTLAYLGVNYKDGGRLAEAIPLLEEAYAAGRKHPRLRWVAAPLLDAYVKDGRPAAAVKGLVSEFLGDARKRLPPGSPPLAGELASLGLSLLQLKAFAEAEPLLRECLAIREKHEPDDWRTGNAQSLLGGALLGQKKYAEAEPLLLKGYEGMKARAKAIPRTGGGELRLPEALDRLIELSTATGKPDEAKKWQAERAKYPRTPPPAEKK
jgi:tetratricopeptide (TPR) repeat protein